MSPVQACYSYYICLAGSNGSLCEKRNFGQQGLFVRYLLEDNVNNERRGRETETSFHLIKKKNEIRKEPNKESIKGTVLFPDLVSFNLSCFYFCFYSAGG